MSVKTQIQRMEDLQQERRKFFTSVPSTLHLLLSLYEGKEKQIFTLTGTLTSCQM